tara:strand:+ start:806 stop:1045 length:240 start_codon:yes stop_codon:yes gene_type:complete
MFNNNTTHIIYAHLFIIGALGIHYYNNFHKDKLQIIGEYKNEGGGEEDMEKNVPYPIFKREINIIKDRLRSIEEEQYIM